MNALQLLNEQDQAEVFEQLKDIMRGYNVEDVAYNAEVAPSTIYFWLEGKTRFPRLNTIIKVAYALGYELKLVKRTGKPKLRIVN